MEDMSLKNYIALGVDTSKLSLFKVLDSLFDADGLISIKDNVDKPITKPKYTDSLDYLRGQYRIKIDTPVPVSDAAKPTKKILKRKLFSVKVKNKSNGYMYCLAPLLITKSDKGVNDFVQWYSNKLIASNYVSPMKMIRQEMIIDSSVIYASSCFYRSRSGFTFDRNRITFQIYFKEWFTMELPILSVKSVTVYTKHPMIKLCLKNKIGDEIVKLCLKYGIRDCDIYRSAPRKNNDVKEVMLIFTNKVLTMLEYERLVLLFGLDKIRRIDSEVESRELIENVLYKNPHIFELISITGYPNWSLIFNPRLLESTPAKTPIHVNNGPTQIKTTIPINNLSTPVKTTTSMNIVQNNIHNLNTRIQHSQPPNVLNIILNCPPTSTPNKFDSMPNIFNRMRGEPQPMMANGTYQLSTINPNISVTAFNQFINNGNRSNPQSMINVPLIVNTNSPATAPITTTTNNIPKPVQSNTLTYVPNRNITNVFETFHYNPSPDSDVLIHGSDLLCLNQGQYLNDNIINFYLNYIRYEIMNDDQRQRTHLFNVFFNTKLQGNPANSASETAEIRHARVAKWTKKVDIFDKDFIIIPINENQHWFLAIVCFPWMAGMISYDKLLGVNNNQQLSEIPVNNTKFATKHRQRRVQRLRDVYGVEPSPCILLFDSLQYQSRASNVKLIRDYLKSEWDSKRGLKDGPLVFDKNTVRGFNPQVPQQDNNIDCGIFVLHYVEQFFSNPLRLFTKEYFQSSLTKWFDTETVTKKRAAIQSMVLSKADKEQPPGAVLSPTSVNAGGGQVDGASHCPLGAGPSTASGGLDDSGPDLQIL